MICPKCREERAHRSHRSSLKDHIYCLFQLIPYRCRACKARFYAYRSGEQSERLRTREERKIMQFRRQLKWKRTRRELVGFALASLLVIFIVYYLIQQQLVSE